LQGKVMDGHIVAGTIRSEIREKVRALADSGIKPNLATVMVGDDPASQSYLKSKHSACIDVGIEARNIKLPADTSQQELHRTICRLNDDESVTGILLQLPLPKSLDDVLAICSITPQKDVDGLHPNNLGLLLQNRADLVPCTPKGVIALLKYYAVKRSGRHAVIINRSKLVGRPLSQLLLNEDATVTVCHSKTEDLRGISKQADILITGIGHRTEFTVQADMIKPGAAVVDIGTSMVDGKQMGDANFDEALHIAAYVSPVPGGVGPVTTAMLLYNTLLAACLQKNVDLGFRPDELKATEPS